MPTANASVQHHSICTQASGSPVRKGTSITAPARPASVKPRPSSPVVVDLCVSPLPQPRAGSSNATTTAVDSHGDKVNEVEMVDASQSPVREAQPVIASTGVGFAMGKAPACLLPGLAERHCAHQALDLVAHACCTSEKMWQMLQDDSCQIAPQHSKVSWESSFFFMSHSVGSGTLS